MLHATFIYTKVSVVRLTFALESFHIFIKGLRKTLSNMCSQADLLLTLQI